MLMTSAARTRARRRKLDLGQTSKEHVHTERQKYEKTHFLLKILASLAKII